MAAGARGAPGLLARWLTAGAVSLTLAACGGSPGGAEVVAPTGLVVTVADPFGARVVGAAVQVEVGGVTTTANTNAQGVAVLGVVPATGDGRLSVAGSSFVPLSLTTSVPAGVVTPLTVTLEREQLPAGGSLQPTGGAQAVAGGAGPLSFSFETELVVVDRNARPIENLSAADFTLSACAPDATTICVRGADPSLNVGYTPLAANPESLSVAASQVAQPFAAALLMDQSGSIQDSDPTGARLFATKSFLSKLGPNDRALLAAFADGPLAKIPSQPLTVFPPFRNATTVTAAPSYFAAIDSLAGSVGGGTPLYSALDLARAQVVGDTSLPAGLAKAIVVFTDGDATDCADASACRVRRDATVRAAQADSVRIFTIGLTNRVNAEALGELANRTGGAFLYADSPAQALTLYASVGKLLSQNLSSYRVRFTVQVNSAAALTSGNTLVGRVLVRSGQTPIEVPFVVTIP